jgi:hypothetical protein
VLTTHFDDEMMLMPCDDDVDDEKVVREAKK